MSLLPRLGGSATWFLLLLHVTLVSVKLKLFGLITTRPITKKCQVTRCRIRLSDFCWCLGRHSFVFFLFIFEGSASFPTGKEVEIPESSSWNQPRGNLKTFGRIFEFLPRPGVLIFGSRGVDTVPVVKRMLTWVRVESRGLVPSCRKSHSHFLW